MSANYHALPLKPPPISRYVMDYETVGRMEDPIETVIFLTDLAAKPEWSREPACWSCENWKQTDGLGKLPHRRGNGTQCVESCSGCVLSHLDQVRFSPTTATKTLAAMEGLRNGWKLLESLMAGKVKKSKDKPFRRVLRWDSVAKEEGYTGKRSDRFDARFSASSFQQKANDPHERIDCPWCHEKNGARVERYTQIKKDESIRFIAIHCLLTPCGRRIVRPEPAVPEDCNIQYYRKGDEPPK